MIYAVRTSFFFPDLLGELPRGALAVELLAVGSGGGRGGRCSLPLSLLLLRVFWRGWLVRRLRMQLLLLLWWWWWPLRLLLGRLRRRG